MFKKLFGGFSKNLGVDLGTVNTRIYIKGRGLVVNQPSVVAVNTRSDQIIAVGDNAQKMVGKSPSHIAVICPLDHGIISDFEVTEKMLKHLIEKLYHESFINLFRPRVVVAIPLDVTEVEKKSLEDVVLQAGAKEVYLVERPVAAAIGARLPIHESIGNLIAEMGGGLSEIAVVSLNGVVTWRSLKIAGQTFNKNIAQYIREKFSVLIGDQSVEEIKIKIGSAYAAKENREMKVRGRDLISGLPKEITVSDEQIREAMASSVQTIIGAISDTIESTPPELVADIYERGIVLSGGGALLKGLDKLIHKKIQIPVHIVDDPLTSVVRGTGLIIEDFENLKGVILPSARE